MSLDDMDKFEEKEMKKVRSFKKTWHDWLINYISESIRKSVGGFKDKVILNTNLKKIIIDWKENLLFTTTSILNIKVMVILEVKTYY